MTGDENESVVLSPHLFVLLESHLDVRVARDLAFVSPPAFAKELEHFSRPGEIRFFGRLVESLDSFVDLANEGLVARLPLLSLLHAHVLPHAPSEQASLGVKKKPAEAAFSSVGGTGLEPATPSLSSLVRE
jgi:hypothetical protein